VSDQANAELLADAEEDRKMIQGVKTSEMTVNGAEYILTVDTGETWYGSEGGHCAFAYDAADYREVASGVSTYQDLCDKTHPVDEFEELRRIAVVAAAREELRVTIPGSCMPVLDDEDYALVREAVAAVTVRQ